MIKCVYDNHYDYLIYKYNGKYYHFIGDLDGTYVRFVISKHNTLTPLDAFVQLDGYNIQEIALDPHLCFLGLLLL